MHHDVPFFQVTDHARSAYSNVVSPVVLHISEFEDEVCKGSLSSHYVRVFGKLQVELLEIGVNINALEARIHKFVDKHEVRVNFYSTTLAQYKADVVADSSLSFDFANAPEFEHW